MSTKKFYLAGPMSGYAQFNFPLFYKVTEQLRGVGMDIISPAELDAKEGVAEEALASTDGNPEVTSLSWADLLARDVKLIADKHDGVHGIVFLPQWSKSRGARLEAFVGLLEGEKREFEFWEYYEDAAAQGGWTLLPMERTVVMALISSRTMAATRAAA